MRRPSPSDRRESTWMVISCWRSSHLDLEVRCESARTIYSARKRVGIRRNSIECAGSARWRTDRCGWRPACTVWIESCRIASCHSQETWTDTWTGSSSYYTLSRALSICLFIWHACTCARLFLYMLLGAPPPPSRGKGWGGDGVKFFPAQNIFFLFDEVIIISNDDTHERASEHCQSVQI